MPFDDVPAFIGKLREREATAALALEFAILTAARSGEVLGARWAEIDAEEKVWTIPASRMKAGREHRVPLSTMVLAILERLCVVRSGPFVFPGCEGVRTGETEPKSGVTPPRAGCPMQWRRYVTIGLPRRGVGLIPENVRKTDPRSFDAGEVWTVLVTETSIGSGGQDWKQYASVLTREPHREGLNLAARFLLTWAE